MREGAVRTRPATDGAPGGVETDPGGSPREHAPRPGPLPPLKDVRSWLPHPTSVPDARRWAAAVLGVWGISDTDDLEVIVSELMTNAVEASAPDWTITVRLLADDELVMVVVVDENEDLPRALSPDDESLSGRGLFIVGALSRDCGYVLGRFGGKSIWATVPRTA